MSFLRPEHEIIHEALSLLDADFFERCGAWFGGGTAIVLQQGEYRLSLDVDFLCSSLEGYRDLRTRAVRDGVRGFFRSPVKEVRPFRCDQYGIRAGLTLHDQPIKFEIVREGRIQVSGNRDDFLGCAVLTHTDQFAEKLLANADRCQDHAVAYRDAIDLGMLIIGYKEIPIESIRKTEAVYGNDICNKARWVVKHLKKRKNVSYSAKVLQMSVELAQNAIVALDAEVTRIWPS